MAENNDMLGFTLQALQQAGQKQQTLVKDTVGKLEKLTQEGTEAADEMVQAVLGGPVNAQGETVLSRSTRRMGELQTQEKMQEFYTSVGMNAEGSAKITNKLGEEYTKQLTEAMTIQEDIKERASVGFFDNPLAHIWNQLMLPDMHAALNATLDKADMAAQGIKKINDMAQQTAQTEAMYSQKLTQAAIDDEATASMNVLKAQAAEAKFKAIANQSHDLVTVMNASQQQLDNISRVISARNQEVHTQLAVEAAGRERVKFTEWQKQVKDKEDYEKQMLEYINYGAKETGAAEFDSPKILAMIRSGQPLPAKLAKLAEIGFVNSATGLHQLSQTPAGTMEAATILNLPVPPAVAQIYDEAKRRLAAESQTPQGAVYLKDKQAAETRFNKIVQDLSKEKQANLDHRDKSNPYLVPPLKVMAQNSELFKSSKLYNSVLKPQIEAGLEDAAPDELIAKALEGVKTGKITISDAVTDITNYYKSGKDLNNVNNQFNRFAVPELTKEVGYKAKVKMLSELANPNGLYNPLSTYTYKEVDLIDPVSVSTFMLKSMRANEGASFSGVLRSLNIPEIVRGGGK